MVKCSFFNQIIVYQSFHGALLTLSNFFSQRYVILVARRLNGSPVILSVYYNLAAHQSSFPRNGKSEGSNERQLYSQATKSEEEIVDGVALLRFSYCNHRYLNQTNKLEANQIHQNLHTSQTRVGKRHDR